MLHLGAGVNFRARKIQTEAKNEGTDEMCYMELLQMAVLNREP